MFNAKVQGNKGAKFSLFHDQKRPVASRCDNRSLIIAKLKLELQPIRRYGCFRSAFLRKFCYWQANSRAPVAYIKD